MRDGIPFGHNASDDLPASRVLADGQCNTKGTLCMALPREVLHSRVEVQLSGRWIALESFILDRPYPSAPQRRFDCTGGCGYGVATDDFRAPPVEWTGGDTCIQHTHRARRAPGMVRRRIRR